MLGTGAILIKNKMLGSIYCYRTSKTLTLKEEIKSYSRIKVNRVSLSLSDVLRWAKISLTHFLGVVVVI